MKAMKLFSLLTLVALTAAACRSTGSPAEDRSAPASEPAKPEIRYYVIGDA
jgi:hypothetical protein